MIDFDQQAQVREEEDNVIRWFGRRGRFDEIAQPLCSLVGPVEDRIVQVPDNVRGPFRGANPSVLVHGDRRLAIIRGVNYRQTAEGSTVFDGSDETCRTQNFWVEFDKDWSPVLFRSMADPMPARPGAVQGYEDCRLFHSAGHYWASCNFAERPKLIGDGVMGLLCEMALLQLSDDGDIEDVKAIRGPWSVYHQKNWKPAPTEAEPLRWVYSSEPLVLVTPAMARDPHRPKWFSAAAWRGGSQALQVGGHWLWVDHRPIVGFDGARNLYLHRFVLADSALERVIAVSDPFVFRNYGIEFCAGAALDGDRLVLSYSVRDAFSFLAICRLENVLGSLRGVA